jgi:hypothetical protein
MDNAVHLIVLLVLLILHVALVTQATISQEILVQLAPQPAHHAVPLHLVLHAMMDITCQVHHV